MIEHETRVQVLELLKEAQENGARLEPCCEVLGIDVRTYQRWIQPESGEVKEDGRPKASRPVPKNKLTEEERQAVLDACHRAEFASLPPTQIVPRLADQGEYIASESTFYRVLRESDEQHHRGRAKRRSPLGPPTSHVATRPCQLWTWDITWLPGPVTGMFFYLYLIIDVYSRKIVGWEVHERESSELAAQVVYRAMLSEGGVGKVEVLHADNGSPQKGSHLSALLERLGVERSHSRPRVSNDNPFSEAIFRTCKYRPEYPSKGFVDIEAARQWVHRFVQWYNLEHRHSAIQYVTPVQRHSGQDKDILDKRKQLYEKAKEKNPGRWSGSVRNFEPAGVVYLNPVAQLKEKPFSK